MLLDEPFVSLDRVVVRELQALVTTLIAQSGATGVLVSHDPQDAARLAHRVVIIAGRPVQIVADLALDALPAQRSRTQIIAYEDRIETAMVESAL
jgi:NitT/TauT family transport system ATP-binding protein/sulfonate transport system ATP-binding protein